MLGRYVVSEALLTCVYTKIFGFVMGNPMFWISPGFLCCRVTRDVT